LKENRDKVVVNIFPSFATWLKKTKNKSMLQYSKKSSKVLDLKEVPQPGIIM
jgi:hypothetical protein